MRTFAWSRVSLPAPWDKKKGMNCLPNIDWISYHGHELRNGVFPEISINKGVTVLMVLALQMWILEPRGHPGRTMLAIWQPSNCCHSLRWVLRSLREEGCEITESVQFSSVAHSCATPWTAAHQASLFITSSQSLLKLMSIKSVMPSNHIILSCPLLLLPSIFPSVRVFSNELVLCIRWPKH